jgi:hypothetical protein
LPGSGTQEDPYRIESLADFDEFAADPNYWAGFTRVETDVNLAGRTYTTAVIAPDGNNTNWEFDGTAFTGVFDGNDHKITNLTIDDVGAGNDYLGLFGLIDAGEVKNLALEAGSVSGRYSVGGLAGDNLGGTITNCFSTGRISGVWDVGGLVGYNGGAITNCYSKGDILGEWFTGGLVGWNSRTITDCYSTGSVSGKHYSFGGLVGANDAAATITNSYSAVCVMGGDEVGGLVGRGYGTIIGSYSTGIISGEYEVGGLAGTHNEEDITDCYATGPVSGYWYVGGLVGVVSGTITDSYSTGSVSGTQDVGGLLGVNSSDNVSNCYSTGDVNGDWVGGLVGENWGSVTDCYSTGDVNGIDLVGGLVGSNLEGSISNCYSTGDVNGFDAVGGLVGENGWGTFPDAWDGYIFNSYSTGSVQGVLYVGGLVGYNNIGDIERSFWDVETSGEPNMCGGQSEYATGCDPNCGKTTAEMQTRSTFTEAGWDFVEIWLINEGATYPVLRQEIRSDLNGNGGVDLLDFAIFADHWLEGKDE